MSFKFKLSIPIFIILFFRLLLFLNFYDYSAGNLVDLDVSVYSGLARVNKINGKYPTKNIYVKTDKVEDGDFKIAFKINKSYPNYFVGDTLAVNKKRTFFIRNYSEKISKRLLKNSSYSLKNFYNAVLFGESRYVHRDLRNKINYVGISHILAMSGLHMGILFFLGNFILKKINLSKRKRNLILLGFISIYVFSIRISPSVMRAYIMLVMLMLGELFYENTSPLKNLIIAIIISHLIYPNSFSSISFQLSYLAVFIIIFSKNIIRKMNKNRYKILDYIFLCLIIQLFLTPISIYYFKIIPIFSLVSNIVLLPIASILIFLCFLGFFLEVFYLGFLLIDTLDITYKIFIYILDLFSSFPLMNIKYTSNISYIYIIINYIVLILILYFMEYWRINYENNKKRM